MSASDPAAIGSPVPALEVGRYGRGVLLACLGALFWSLSGVLIRLTEAATSWQIVFYRALAMSLTLLLILAVRYRGRVDLPLRRGGRDALLAGLAFSSASCCFILAIGYVTVANALFMSGIAPFITALLARAWLGESVPSRTWYAMLLAAAGVVVMVRSSLAFDGLFGNVLALGSAVSFALVSACLRKGRQNDMAAAVLWSGLSSTMAAAVILAVTGEGFAITQRDLALCAFMGTVQLGLGSLCYAYAARHLAAAPLQLLALAELVLSPVWVWLVVDEVPTAATLVGGAMILVATAFQASARMPRPVAAGVG
jgi:drug/metabolite transporter (DMT)-like permease